MSPSQHTKQIEILEWEAINYFPLEEKPVILTTEPSLQFPKMKFCFFKFFAF